MHWRVPSVLLRITAVVIIALHAGLLWRRIENLSITEPEVIARWCAAAIAAAAALLLLHFRVSRRSWLVFGVVIVLLHAALPVEGARLDVLAEAVFAIAPLMWLAAALTSAPLSGTASLIDEDSVAFPITLLSVSLPSRAPPSR